MRTKNLPTIINQLITLPLLFLMVFFANKLSAQGVDTVCANTSGKAYAVSNTAGSTYQWFISGGTQASGTNTYAITVNWGSTPGLYSIKVVETSSHGCIGDTVSLPVRILPLPTASLAGTASMCSSDPTGQITVTFTGSGPFNFAYTNGTVTTNVNNVTSNPYSFTPTPAPSAPAPGGAPITTTYSLVSVSGLKACAGTVSGSAAITIYPKPVTSAITF